MICVCRWIVRRMKSSILNWYRFTEYRESEKKEELIDLSKECDSEPSPRNNKSENEGDTNSEDSDFVPVILESTKKKNKKSEMSTMQTISTDSQAHEYLTCQCPICNCFYREKDIEVFSFLFLFIVLETCESLFRIQRSFNIHRVFLSGQCIVFLK